MAKKLYRIPVELSDAIRLNAEIIVAGTRCTELRSVRDKTRRGSAQHTAATDALFDAQANHAELERQRDSAWAVANRRRESKLNQS